MVLMAGCGLLLLVAAALVVRWRREVLVMPTPREARPSVPWLLRIYLWLMVVGAVAGLVTALLVIGPGGRLAMRLLAATSPEAQGRITEAQEVVGVISLRGTLTLLIFGGLIGGPAVGMFYVLFHRVRRGPLGGALFGLLLLVALGTRLDPLRPDNVDFRIVGPGWLAVAVFALLAVLTGLFVAVAAARLSRYLPLPGRSAFVYVPVLALLCLPTFAFIAPTGPVVLLGALVFVLASRYAVGVPPERRILVLRAAAAVLTVALLPGFVTAVADISSAERVATGP